MQAKLSDYGFVRFGVATPELKVADTPFNTSKIIDAIKKASEEECGILLFPELSVTGYTCGDLFYQKTLLDSVEPALKKIAEATAEFNITVIVGAPIREASRLFNTAIVISNGEITGIVPKTYLCNTNEYYEKRWFTSDKDRITEYTEIAGESVPFGTDLIFKVDGTDCIFGIEICEDLWAPVPPSFSMAAAGANVILNLSASSEYLGKSKYRDSLIIGQSGRCYSAYCYAAAGPGESTTDLIFAGKSLIAEDGHLLAETTRFSFETQIAYADIDIEKLEAERLKSNSFASSEPDKTYRFVNIHEPVTTTRKFFRQYTQTPFIPRNLSERAESCREIFSIQSTALAKRLKHIGSKDIVVGISGGLDSTLALLVCVKAFGILGLPLKNIHAVSMPGFGTTARTKTNAMNLAKLCGASFSEIDITEAVTGHLKDISHDINDRNIVYENAQARERTQILMDLANKYNAIVAGTGDLSEIALGWSTYNGDHISMYGINSGVPKTLVKYIVEWAAEEEFKGDLGKVLFDICDTPISPELLPADENGEITQKTENEIGPYILHDFFLYHFFRFGYSTDKLKFIAEIAFKDLFTESEITKWLEVFINRFFSQQFKRSCMPDGIKVGSVALSPRGDWRMPSDAKNTIW